MALKPDRTIIHEDISYFVNALTGLDTVTRMERGGILCATTGIPSGAAMDTSANAAEYATNPSGRRPVGILMNDFVNIDLSRQQLNRFKDEAQIGTKAAILRDGIIVTNMIDSTSATGSVPQSAYTGPSGLLTATNNTGYTQVGEFLTRKDADGYSKVRISF